MNGPNFDTDMDKNEQCTGNYMNTARFFAKWDKQKITQSLTR